MRQAIFLQGLCFAVLAPMPVFSQTSTDQMVDWQPFVPTMTDYVRASRHWTDDQYEVKFANWNDDGTLSFYVIWKWPASHPVYPGNDGKSFNAIVDPATGKVIRELRGQ